MNYIPILQQLVVLGGSTSDLEPDPSTQVIRRKEVAAGHDSGIFRSMEKEQHLPKHITLASKNPTVTI